jgi:hypothetical protein
MADSPEFIQFARSVFKTARDTRISSIVDIGDMDFVTVDSTCLTDVSYDLNSKILTVTFKESGATYDYFGVAESDYESLVQATSVGKKYNAIIKYNHSYLRVS